jgi:hypothetical protein
VLMTMAPDPHSKTTGLSLMPPVVVTRVVP